jgi:hypothetical protein
VKDLVWLVWDGQALLGMYAARVDAERRQRERRAENGVQDDRDPQGWSVRVEPWTSAPPSGLPPFERPRDQRRAILGRVDREWGLLSIPEMGTGHCLHLDTYLVVPYENRLTCPAFQFDHWRELWPGFRDVLKVFRDAGWDEFSITSWFVSRQGSADGDTPALLIRDAPDRVLTAARSTAVDW